MTGAVWWKTRAPAAPASGEDLFREISVIGAGESRRRRVDALLRRHSRSPCVIAALCGPEPNRPDQVCVGLDHAGWVWSVCDSRSVQAWSLCDSRSVRLESVHCASYSLFKLSCKPTGAHPGFSHGGRFFFIHSGQLGAQAPRARGTDRLGPIWDGPGLRRTNQSMFPHPQYH